MTEHDAPGGRRTIEWLSDGADPPERPGPRGTSTGGRRRRVGLPRRTSGRVLLATGAAALIGLIIVTALGHPRHTTAVVTYRPLAPQAAGGPRTVPVAVDGPLDAPSGTFLATLGRPLHVPLLAPQDTAGLVSMPWELTKVSDGGRTLDIAYAAGDGSCYTKKGFEVLETPLTVELLALSADRRPPGTACLARLDLGYAAVPLAHRLAGRTLLHAPVQAEWVNALRGL